MEEAARPAGPEDLDTIAALHALATEELRAERGGRVWALEHARDAGFRPPPAGAGLVLAGTIDGVIVGYAVVRLDELAGGARLAVLEDVYVEAPARGVGVGAALLDAAVTWATGQRCIGIDAVALPGMRASKNFFEAAGLVARAIVVHRGLPER